MLISIIIRWLLNFFVIQHKQSCNTSLSANLGALVSFLDVFCHLEVNKVIFAIHFKVKLIIQRSNKIRIILIKFYTNGNKLIIIFVCVIWLKEPILVVTWLSRVTYKVKTQIYMDRHVYGKYVCICNWDMDQREQLAWLSTKDRWLNGPQALRYAVSSQLMSTRLVLWYLLK